MPVDSQPPPFTSSPEQAVGLELNSTLRYRSPFSPRPPTPDFLAAAFALRTDHALGTTVAHLRDDPRVCAWAWFWGARGMERGLGTGMELNGRREGRRGQSNRL